MKRRPLAPARVVERARSHVTTEGECIVSLYSKNANGYAQIGCKDPGEERRMWLAYCVIWEAVHGPVPEGMSIDHICHNPACVREEHLRLLTARENFQRNGPDRDFPLGWSCRRNHPASALVEVTKRGRPLVTCSDCIKEGRARWRQKQTPERLRQISNDSQRRRRQAARAAMKVSS